MATMKKTAPKKAAYSTKPKDKESLIQDITNRFSVTAREARDIVTSVGTVLATTKQLKPSAGGMGVTASSSRRQRQALSDLGKQIKETASAAKTGKSGTTALNSNSRVKNRNTGVVLAPGKKR
jgi:hypothetical protein